jgi:lactose/L-arabinose transport system substrate-binding protein
VIWQDVLDTLDEISPARGSQFFQEARQIVTAIQAEYLNGGYDSAQAALDAAAEQISGATGLPIAE